jgi:cytochrome b561
VASDGNGHRVPLPKMAHMIKGLVRAAHTMLYVVVITLMLAASDECLCSISLSLSYHI